MYVENSVHNGEEFIHEITIEWWSNRIQVTRRDDGITCKLN